MTKDRSVLDLRSGHVVLDEDGFREVRWVYTVANMPDYTGGIRPFARVASLSGKQEFSIWDLNEHVEVLDLK